MRKFDNIEDMIFIVFLIANLIAIMIYSFKEWADIKEMKYGLPKAIAAIIFNNDYEPLGWILERRYYFFDYGLAISAQVMCVIQASQLDVGLPQIRTVWNLVFALLFWTALAFKDHYKNKYLFKTEIKLIKTEQELEKYK